MDYENQKILGVEMEKEFKKSFLEYAMSVIVARALPDVRDGLKPVHRRILYAMYEEGLTNDKPYRKSATTVGNVMGRYHPHGDAAIYDTLVRLAQDFSLRYPFVDGQGNFGSIDGDMPAAMRYTEARLAKVAAEMLTDIKKDTVDFGPNYDNKLQEPLVLPSRIPNLLVNGSVGIAVGMATNIPPHNLCEVVDACIEILDNPEATLEDLMAHIKGPDFPTAGLIMGRSGIRAAYATGRGHIKMRARAEIEENGSRYRIVVTEIPYMVNKQKLVESIGILLKEQRIEGISEVRDESDHRIRVVIDIKKDANPQVVLNQLYRYTQLQDTFAVNMLALADNVPRTLTLSEMLRHYVDHQRQVLVRRARFDLRKFAERMHILKGLRIAVDNIDEVVRIIRASSSIAEAKKALMERFRSMDVGNMLTVVDENYDPEADSGEGLSEAQATEIVNMRLGQLTGLELNKINSEYDELREKAADLRDFLQKPERVDAQVREDLLTVKSKYGDERRTQIENVDDDIDIEDLIKEEDCVYTLTRAGYIKRIPASTYRSQRRGGRGITGMATREEDDVETLFVASTHDYILFFTSNGRLYRLKGYKIPESGRASKGMNIVNLLQLEGDERVTAMINVREFEENAFVVMVTKNGTVKRMELAGIDSSRKAGVRAINLGEGDSLIRVIRTGGEDDILVGTKNGLAVRFCETDARPRGRVAGGVRAIRLEEGDEVIGAAAVREGEYVLTITENGYGKLTPEAEYARHHRGGKGIRLHAVTQKTGGVAGLMVTALEDDLLCITDAGMIIRTAISDIRVCGRSTQGVIVMRLAAGVKVISIEKTEAEEQEPQQSEEESTEDGEPVENSVENVEDSDE